MAGPLIGRADELQAVLALLADPGVRAVVLAGPSGVGKTKLALAGVDAWELGHRLVVPLSSVREGEVMADAVVAALGASVAFGERPAQALWRSFAGEPVLLLLDNLEQVDGAAEVVLALLEGYPAARVLATSLGELGVPGERVVRLGPLPVGRDGTDEQQPAALRMFVERALTRDVTHPPSPADLRAAEEICRAVGGLPLAIELAAARAGSMPLTLMAAQLSAPTGHRLLDRAPAGSPERHQSLFAALAWTVDLLPPAAADLLAAMSVFDGPTTLEGIASVAPSDGMALDLLSTLLDVSLVDVDAGDAEEPLFSLLPPVRAFAGERLAENGTRAEVVHRHDRFVRARCRTGEALQPHEMADVLAALDRAQLDGSADAALDLALQAARVTTAPGGRASVATRVENLLGRPHHDDVLAARALVWSVSHLPADVDDREAFATWTLERVQQAIRTARTSGDPAALLDALELTIRTLPLTLDMELAKAGIAEGLELAERHDDPGRLARFRMWVGMGALSQGQVEPARALLLAAFAGGSATGDRVATDYAAIFLRAMGVVDTGAPELPLPAAQDLLESAWRHQDGFAAAIVLGQLVTQALDAGDVGSAAGLTLQLLPIGASRLGVEPLPSATMLTVPVRVLVAAGQLVDAAPLCATLAPLDPLLRNALGRPDYLAYSAAADLVQDAGPGTASGSLTEAPSLLEAFRQAEKLMARLATPPLDQRPARPTPAPSPEPLTAREHEVLLMLVDGAGNREIALALGISSKTVMHHTVAIYRKLGVRGRTEAATWAVRTGVAPGR
ncbi:MAG TPA: LuxR C-terminal-related transcriptional regulator [Ornithinibacter sp.]|nr:LuxR C-terminal-related transcriptional regulator [Ornithinibacter sp.]